MDWQWSSLDGNGFVAEVWTGVRQIHGRIHRGSSGAKYHILLMMNCTLLIELTCIMGTPVTYLPRWAHTCAKLKKAYFRCWTQQSSNSPGVLSISRLATLTVATPLVYWQQHLQRKLPQTCSQPDHNTGVPHSRLCLCARSTTPRLQLNIYSTHSSANAASCIQCKLRLWPARCSTLPSCPAALNRVCSA